jgi:hypothetical protein
MTLTTFGSPERETRVALGIPPIRAYPRAWTKGALRNVWAQIWMKSRNPINRLLAPQSLVRPSKGNQWRPKSIILKNKNLGILSSQRKQKEEELFELFWRNR